MKKIFSFICCLSILLISFSSFTHKEDAFELAKSKSAFGRSTKVVGVIITVTNNTSHTLTFSYNGVTTGSFTVSAHSSSNGRISAQPGTVYTITVSEGVYAFYYLDNAGHNGGPITGSQPFSVTLNDGYLLTTN